MSRIRATLHAAAVVALLAPLAPVPAVAQQQTLRAGALLIHHGPERAVLARVLAAPPALTNLPALPDSVLSAREPVHVFLATDEEEWSRLTGGRAPEWGAGIAMREPERIVLPAYDSDRGSAGNLRRVLRHELAHVALNRYVAPAIPPRWFNEGYARWAAGEWDWEAAWQLRISFALHQAPPLDSLELAWPRGITDARVAYALSASAVAFLVERGGERALGIMLERWRETQSFDTALRRTYGVTLGQLEEDWRRDVRRSYGWLFFLSHSVVFWLAVTALTLLLFLPRRRVTQQKLERLRETEPPDDPAYWLEQEEQSEPEGR